MVFECFHRSGMNIAREADLKRNSLVENVSGERAHAHDVSIFDLHVFDEPCCVTYPMSSAPLDGLPDRLFAEGLARVDGDIEVFSLYVMKRIHMLLGRVSTLFTCKIEADYSVRSKIDS